LADATMPAGFLRRTRTSESCLLPSSRSSFHFSKVANVAQPIPDISLEHSIADRIGKFDSWLNKSTEVCISFAKLHEEITVDLGFLLNGTLGLKITLPDAKVKSTHNVMFSTTSSYYNSYTTLYRP
jgi:hypothetical protein